MNKDSFSSSTSKGNKSLLPRIALLLSRKSKKKIKRDSAVTWINKAKKQSNFNKFKVGTLLHETFQTHTIHQSSQNPNRWISFAKNVPQGHVSPIKNLQKSMSVPSISLGPGKLTLPLPLQQKEEERRLERFGSRLGSTLPESMTSAGNNEIVYLGEGRSVVLEKRNISLLLSNLETTQSILFESNNGPKPYVEPGTTKNADRYGHTGAWYKRTSQKHADTHGLRNILLVGGRDSGGSNMNTNTNKNTNNMNNNNNNNSMISNGTGLFANASQIIPWDELENGNSVDLELELQQKQAEEDLRQRQLERAKTPDRIMGKNRKSMSIPRVRQVPASHTRNGDQEQQRQKNEEQKRLEAERLKTTQLEAERLEAEQRDLERKKRNILNQQNNPEDNGDDFAINGNGVVKGNGVKEDKQHHIAQKLVKHHNANGHQAHKTEINHLAAKPLYELGSITEIVAEANHHIIKKHTLVAHAISKDTHGKVGDTAREIAEIHQMAGEDWDAARNRWYENSPPSYLHHGSETREQGSVKMSLSGAPAKTWRSMKVFISSTFRDMHGERDVINTVVIPQVNEMLKEYHIQLHAVDLRWGLTAEDTSSGGLGALEHCLREVETSRPFFIALLGERYGWCPPSYKISDRPEFDWIKTHPLGYSITHMEIIQGLLQKWGKPIHGFCYERDPSFIDNIQDIDAKNIYEFDHGDNVDKINLRNELRSELHSHPYTVYHHYRCKYGGRDVHGRARTSDLGGLAEQMIADITSSIIEEYHLLDLRKASMKEFKTSLNQRQATSSNKKKRGSMMMWPQALALEKHGISSTTDDHMKAIAEVRRRHEAEAKFLHQEAKFHEQYIHQFALNYIQRPLIQAAIMEKINECDSKHESKDVTLEEQVGVTNAVRTVAVLGRQGSGKTSLLSQIARTLSDNELHPRAVVFSHLCGASPSSGDLKMLLHRIGSAVARHFSIDKLGVSNLSIFRSLTMNDCRIWFEEMLHTAAKRATQNGNFIIIIIDGCDQMDDKDNALSLEWLPSWTPTGCRIFISASVDLGEEDGPDGPDGPDGAGKEEGERENKTDETYENNKKHFGNEQEKNKILQIETTMSSMSSEADPLDVRQKVSQLHLHQQPSIENALAGRDPPLPVVAVGNLINEQASNVVKSLLKTHSKRLTNDQHRLILTKEDHTSALYLWAVLEELRLGGDFGLDGQVINQMIAAFPSTLEPLFNQVLERIEGEVDHFCGETHSSGVKHRVQSGYQRHSTVGHPGHPPVMDGRYVVQHVLSLLAVSRNGLYETDLLKMVVPIGWPHGESLPTVVWSRIYHAVEMYLRTRSQRDHGIISFSQRGFARAVRKRYLGNEIGKQMYKQLADFMLSTSGIKSYEHGAAIFARSEAADRRHSVTAFIDIPYYQIRALDIVGMRDDTLGNLAYVEMCARLSSTEQNGNLLANLIHDYRSALESIRLASKIELAPHLKKAETTKREVIWWMKGMLDFVTQQQHNLIRAPLLTLQLALQELNDSASHVWAKEIILMEQLDSMENESKSRSSSKSGNGSHNRISRKERRKSLTGNIHQFLYCRWMNKPSLHLLKESHGPFAAGGTCVADLGGGLDVCGLENGDVIIIERTSGEIISAVRSSSYAKSSYGHCACICSISVSPTGEYFVTTSMDHQIIVWDSLKLSPLAHGGMAHIVSYDTDDFSSEEDMDDDDYEETEQEKESGRTRESERESEKESKREREKRLGSLSPLRRNDVADVQQGHNNIVSSSSMLGIDVAPVTIQPGSRKGTRTKMHFVTGSLDKTTRLWSFTRDLPNETDPNAAPGTPNTANNDPDRRPTYGEISTLHGDLKSLCKLSMLAGVLSSTVREDLIVVAVGMDSGHVQLLDCSNVRAENSMTIAKSWKAHRTSVSDLAYVCTDAANQGKHLLATAGLDCTVKIWSNSDSDIPRKIYEDDNFSSNSNSKSKSKWKKAKNKSQRKVSDPIPLRILHSSVGGISVVKWAPLPHHLSNESNTTTATSSNRHTVRHLVAGTLKEEILVWSIDVDSLRAIRVNSFEGHADVVNGLHFATMVATVEQPENIAVPHSKMAMVSISSDRHVNVWDLNNFEEEQNNNSNKSNNKKQTLINDTLEGTAKEEELKTARMYQGQAHEMAVTACALSADGMIAVTGDLEGRCIVWNARTGSVITELYGTFFSDKNGGKSKRDGLPAVEISTLSTSMNGNTIVAGTFDGTILLWQRQYHVKNNSKGTNPLLKATSNYQMLNNTVVTRSYTLQISQPKVHGDAGSLRCVHVLTPESGSMTVVEVLTGDGETGTVKVFAANTGVKTTALREKNPDHKLLLKHELEHEAGVHEITYRRCASNSAAAAAVEGSTSASLSCSILAVATKDYGVTLWDVSEWIKLKTFVNPNVTKGREGLTTFSPDTCQLVLFDWQNRSASVRNTKEKEEQHATSTHEVLEQAIAHARQTSMASHHGRHQKMQPPPRLQTWHVKPEKRQMNVGKENQEGRTGKNESDEDKKGKEIKKNTMEIDKKGVQSGNNEGESDDDKKVQENGDENEQEEDVEEEEEEEEEEEKNEDIDPVWSTFASHPQDRLLGDKLSSHPNLSCTASQGRFILGAFEDSTLRGYDTTLKSRSLSIVFPDGINCLAASSKSSEVVCGDIHGRVYIFDLGIDLESTWNANRLNNAGDDIEIEMQEEQAEQLNKTKPVVSFIRHRHESTTMSKLRLDRAKKNNLYLSSNKILSYFVRKPVNLGRRGCAICIYAVEADDNDDEDSDGGTGKDANEILNLFGLAHRNSKEYLCDNTGIIQEYSSGLQIMGTLSKGGSTHSLKFAFSQIQSAIEKGVLPAATEASSVVFGYGANAMLSKMIGLAYNKMKKLESNANKKRKEEERKNKRKKQQEKEKAKVKVKQEGRQTIKESTIEGYVEEKGEQQSQQDAAEEEEEEEEEEENGLQTGKPTCHLLGVTPLVNTSISKDQIKSFQNSDTPFKWPATLEKSHEKIVLMDYTSGMGEDTNFLSDIHKCMARDRVPSVVVLVRGGDEEKESLLHLVRLGIPIVVLEGTGGFADEIATLRLSIKKREKQRSWALVRTKLQGKKTQFEQLIALIRMKDDVTKMIVMYKKLHVVSIGDAPSKLKELLVRLLCRKR